MLHRKSSSVSYELYWFILHFGTSVSDVISAPASSLAFHICFFSGVPLVVIVVLIRAHVPHHLGHEWPQLPLPEIVHISKLKLGSDLQLPRPDRISRPSLRSPLSMTSSAVGPSSTSSLRMHSLVMREKAKTVMPHWCAASASGTVLMPENVRKELLQDAPFGRSARFSWMFW